MIGATLLTAALTGCSGGKTADAPASSADQTTAAEAASTDAASEGKVAIELFYQKPENVELYNTLVNKFMEENPDIQDPLLCVICIKYICFVRMFVYFITTRRELQDQPYIRFAAIGTAITVIKPATAMERLLIAPSISPNSSALAVPMA